MRTAELKAEWRAAQDALSKSDALELLALRFPQGVIMHMIGIARVRLRGSLYEPDTAGKWAYISPARIYDIHSPFTDWQYPTAVLGGELIDLICWDLGNTHAWASRCRSAEWLGCATCHIPTPICRSPVAWLRHRCSGLVLLTSDRIRQYEILSDCNDLVAEDDYHADQLSDALSYPYPRRAVFVA